MFLIRYRQNYITVEPMIIEAENLIRLICSDEQKKAQVPTMVNCRESESLIRMGVYEKALHLTIEDMSFCTGAQCYEILVGFGYSFVYFFLVLLFIMMFVCFILNIRASSTQQQRLYTFDLPVYSSQQPLLQLPKIEEIPVSSNNKKYN